MPVLVVAGYGAGISHATARRFGAEGYAVALIGRDSTRLQSGVAALQEVGVQVRDYQADLSVTASVRDVVGAIRSQMGPISAILWTAFRNGDVSDVLQARPEQVTEVFQVGVVGLLAAVESSLEDLRAEPGAAVLVANGAAGEPSADADRFAFQLGMDGTALENAAKSKLAGILAERLRADDVYVGEVTIAGSIQGTETAGPTAIDPVAVADRFWTMARDRTRTRERMTERVD